VPRVSVWLIRVALLHLLSGAYLGAAYLTFKGTGWPAWAASHRPVHVEQMLMGWMVQLVIGVAFWILPSRTKAPPASPARLMWLVFVLLNGGVVLASFSDPSRPAVELLGRCAETGAVALFAVLAWNRQRPYTPAARKLVL
jgi:cbb3-type cytochrome oxidase subunit 1